MNRLVIGAAAIAAALAPAATAAASNDGAAQKLEARAILPADATWPAPFPGAPNTDPAPAPGSVQPVGGFSALIDAGDGDFYAMPDNGFGSKANSRSFILRLYKVRPKWQTRPGRPGSVTILSAITLRDPDLKVPFPIVNESTPDRILTGGDFDVESVRQGKDGTFWFGEEFGPFIVHVDATGKVLDAPVPTPGVMSPSNPFLLGRTANLPNSSGFEGMALSTDGKTLYPFLEGALVGADPLDRVVFEFDVEQRRFTGRRWTYRMSRPDTFVSDVTALDRDHMVVLERDNLQGAAAAWKRAFVIDTPGHQPVIQKRQILDLLGVGDEKQISLTGARTGDVGLGDPFKFPYQTVEAILPVGRDEFAIVNDTNFGSTGRNPSLPDYSDFIVVKADER
jgi:glycerophosphoryl diester phosphodiesterase